MIDTAQPTPMALDRALELAPISYDQLTEEVHGAWALAFLLQEYEAHGREHTDRGDAIVEGTRALQRMLWTTRQRLARVDTFSALQQFELRDGAE